LVVKSIDQRWKRGDVELKNIQEAGSPSALGDRIRVRLPQGLIGVSLTYSGSSAYGLGVRFKCPASLVPPNFLFVLPQNLLIFLLKSLILWINST